MKLAILVFVVAFLMEAIGSWISVWGLSQLFAGDIVILAMSLIMDVAKLVTVSVLYQYWDELKKLFRGYLVAAVLVLVTITSAGAFGYLSSAFQRAIAPSVEVQLTLKSKEAALVDLTEQRDLLIERRTSLETQLAKLPDNVVRGRVRLLNAYAPQLNEVKTKLEQIDAQRNAVSTEVANLRTAQLQADVHAGPITYLAATFGVSAVDASKYIILVIIGVFDPLAIALVIAGNFIIARKRNETFTLPAKSDTIEPLPSRVSEESTVALEEAHDRLNEIQEAREERDKVLDNDSPAEPVHPLDGPRCEHGYPLSSPSCPLCGGAPQATVEPGLDSVRVDLASAVLPTGATVPSNTRSIYEARK